MNDVSFLAIDFETANPDQASVCQVGIAKVLRGAIVDSTSWLVIPPTGLQSFESRFIGIHGITPQDVQHTGISWQESLQRIQQHAAGLPFVAHNTSFDKTVYRRASEYIGVPVPETTWFDTVVLSRRLVSSPNHKLPTVAKALQLPDFSHHEAEADAITSALIALELARRHGLHTLHDLWPPAAPRRRSFPQRIYTRVGDLPAPSEAAHPQHPFFGHQVAITGDFDDLSRDDFIVQVAQCGGQPQLNVTKKTTILVVADVDVLPLDYDPSRGSRKEQLAGRYRDAGQPIQFLGARQAVSALVPDAVSFVAKP